MKRTIIFLLTIISLNFSKVKADEGMWIPALLQSLNQKEMQDLGFKLTAEDIYSINHSSMKDAIVLFGGGCTAEIVSKEGLILTNHHCGFGAIQNHSSVNNNYLRDGFWAASHQDELPNEGLTATILIRMEDVTLKILEGVNPDMSENQREQVISSKIKELETEIKSGSQYEAKIKPFYFGNVYYLFVTQVFKDIRLVGAPPSSIGKFGGDTDNWMWPRHTGDFSVFRIYTSDGTKPATYSKSNVPLQPKYHFPISLKGVKEGDFTFVFGYPGSTDQYLTSHAVKLEAQVRNPAKIDMRQQRLDIYEKYMNMSDSLRLKYAGKQASVANYWKKMIGESKGVERMNGVQKKQKFEAEFGNWVNADKERQKKYGNLISSFSAVYQEYTPLALSFDYFIEAAYSQDIIKYSYSFSKLVNDSKDKMPQEDMLKNYQKGAAGYFKNMNKDLEKEMFIALISYYYKNLDSKLHPDEFQVITLKFDGSVEKYADFIFSKSIFFSQKSLEKILNGYSKSSYKKIEADPLYKLTLSLYGNYINNISPKMVVLDAKLDSLYRVYVQGMMEMQPSKRFYPDANSTLRVTYGVVKGYKPYDGVKYEYFTTLDGIMQKDNPKIYDYQVDKKLKDLWAAKNYGEYADPDGTLHVAFTATNHTTGGNSGSPVLNAEGQLIGINFDRCWEGTMSDIVYDPDQCRNISLDIRYCLFVIDKFADARHLVEEMTIVR